MPLSRMAVHNETMNEDKRFKSILDPLSLRVADLRDVWLSSRRGRPEAIAKLASLLRQHPELQPVIEHIETVSKAMFKKNRRLKKSGKPSGAPTPPGAWERLREKTGVTKTRINAIQGGLPSLGKK